MSTKEEVAQRIADRHFFVDGDLKRVFRIRRIPPDRENSLDEPIKLLQLNEFTVAAGILPLGFPRRTDEGFDYPYIIVEITPEEFELMRLQQLKLPEGWVVGEELPCSDEADEEDEFVVVHGA